MKNISYNMHHSPWGSYCSFIMGELNKGGGFVRHDVQPPRNNIYIAYTRGRDKIRMLPFYSNHKSGISEDHYVTLEENSGFEGWAKEYITPFSPEEIEREINWGSDKWHAGDLTFSLITPFGNVPPPEEMTREEAMFRVAPLILAQITLDNRDSDREMKALFALQGLRCLLSDRKSGNMSGAVAGNACGIGIQSDDSVKEVLDWSAARAFLEDSDYPRRLGNEGGLIFSIPPGVKKSYTMVLGFYKEGVITANRKCRMYYSRYFGSLEEVLSYGLENSARYLKEAEDRGAELSNSRLSEERKDLLAIAAAGYLANTELLAEEDGSPCFVVNEGEYQMMNTMDLVVDQAFWELHYTPWTVKNELESFIKFYSYHDRVVSSGGNERDAGITFCHDQGVADIFSPPGYSAYEMPGLTGCFSYMSGEELLNWILTASLYSRYGKDPDWLLSRRDLVKSLFYSLKARDADGDGIMDSNSSRCRGGWEITTYDSLDPSLGQAVNNLYLGVKTWSAYVSLGWLFKQLDEDEAQSAYEEAGKCAATIISKMNKEEKYIPAVFDNANTSRIIPAVEGLLYPYLLGMNEVVSPTGIFGPFIEALKTHLETVLKPGVCLDAESGGWKLSSTNNNTWMSKIFINQYVAFHILKFQSPDLSSWDKIHLNWQKESCGHFAATDQVDSRTGKDLGSRLYPRLVTAVLFLHYI